MQIFYLLFVASLGFTALAQYFPPAPEGVTTLKSKYHEGVKISYKEPGICETTPGVKSYSGYVHLPPGLLRDITGEEQDYPINTFFWFFEARKDPVNAPLSIWLNGGPGGSSMMGLLQENGPCFIGADSNSTLLNPYSWNNEVNMLYLDQPSKVGFSYEIPTNGTLNLPDLHITQANFSESVPEQNNTFRVGTFGGLADNSTINSTVHAAHAIWHFAQTWFFEFPYYKPHDDKISLWTESYGGHYGPSFIRFFQEQNEKIRNGTISDKGTKYIHLDTLGIINGCIDALLQTRSWPNMAYNNTYGIKAINDSAYQTAVDAFDRPDGCRDQIMECRRLMKKFDPDALGNNRKVNSYCSQAMGFCEQEEIGPYVNYTNFGKNGWYDIGHPKADPFPEPYLYGFLQQHWVQGALGVPVNYSAINMAVSEAFQGTGDFLRPNNLEAIGYVLDSGVKVALVYGDRDFACNWIGGEEVSTAVQYSMSDKFRGAGYTPIISSVGIGGQVRQYGNYSFSRVYQAGHEVPSYQPEVSYDIFMRALTNKDVATGIIPVTDDYTTFGPSSTWHIKNRIPPQPMPTCYVLSPETCTEEVYETVKNGTAVVKDYMVVELEEDSNSRKPDQKAQQPLIEEL